MINLHQKRRDFRPSLSVGRPDNLHWGVASRSFKSDLSSLLKTGLTDACLSFLIIEHWQGEGWSCRKMIISHIMITHLRNSYDQVCSGVSWCRQAVVGFRLPQALVNVINSVFAADESVEVFLHKGFELTCPLTDLILQMLTTSDQICQQGVLQRSQRRLDIHFWHCQIDFGPWNLNAKEVYPNEVLATCASAWFAFAAEAAEHDLARYVLNLTFLLMWSAK